MSSLSWAEISSPSCPPSPSPLSLLAETPHAELLCLCQSRKTSSNFSLSPVCKTIDADAFYLRTTFIDICVACGVSVIYFKPVCLKHFECLLLFPPLIQSCNFYDLTMFLPLKKVWLKYLKLYSGFSAFSLTNNIIYPGGNLHCLPNIMESCEAGKSITNHAKPTKQSLWPSSNVTEITAPVWVVLFCTDTQSSASNQRCTVWRGC